MPREIVRKFLVYKINEHPHPERCYNKWREKYPPDHWAEEWQDTLKTAWNELFGLNIPPEWSHDYCDVQAYIPSSQRLRISSLVSSDIDDEEVEYELTGVRLWKWCMFRFEHILYKRYFLYRFKKEDDTWSERLPTNDHVVPPIHKVARFVPGHASISRPLVEKECPFTGVISDEILLKPIRDFLKRPTKGMTLLELADAMLSAWAKGWEEEMESQSADEYLKDFFEANDYEFKEDGSLYSGG